MAQSWGERQLGLRRGRSEGGRRSRSRDDEGGDGWESDPLQEKGRGSGGQSGHCDIMYLLLLPDLYRFLGATSVETTSGEPHLLKGGRQHIGPLMGLIY